MTVSPDPLGDLTASGSKRIILSIDAMGGDEGPAAIVAGISRSAKKNPDLGFIVHGPKAELAPLIAKRKELVEICDLRDVPDVVKMTDKPSQTLRTGKNTSMWSAIEAVRSGEAAACVSCGNTGALMAMSMIRLRKLPGVNRPAIGILWPSRSEHGFNVMLDVGADIRADAGLLNVGTEEHKGRSELHDASELIESQAAAADFEYVGFVEGGDIPGDRADVIVTDGFTGNVALKTGEGTASLIGDRLREAFKYSLLSKFAALLALTSLKRLRQRIDPRRVNGGVFLGLNGTVVKSHGSADATGVDAAINLAFRLAQSGFSDRLAKRIAASTTAAAKSIAEES